MNILGLSPEKKFNIKLEEGSRKSLSPKKVMIVILS